MGTLSCGLVFLLGRRYFGRVVGTAAGLVAATYWYFLYFEGELLIVSLIILLDLIFLWLFVRAYESKSLPGYMASGFVLGISALARPNILLFGIVACVWVLGTEIRQWRGALLRTSLFGALCLVPILPITVRNAVEGDDFVLISSQGGVNFYIGNNPESDGTTAIVPGTRPGWWDGYYDAIAIANQSEGRELKPSEVSQFFFGESLEYITQNPKSWLSLMWKKMGFLWKSAELTNNKPIKFFAEKYAPITRGLPIGFGLVGPLALLGLALCLGQARRTFPLWGFAVVYSVSIWLFFVCTRFKMPMMPVLIILACASVQWLIVAWRNRRYVPATLGALALVPLFLWINAVPKSHFDPSFAGFEILGDLESNRGNLAEAALYYGEAIRKLDEGTGIKPPYGVVLRGKLGTAHLRGGDIDRAEEVFLSARGMQFRHPAELARVLIGLGHVYDVRGDTQKAIGYYRATLERTPANAAAHCGLGNLLATKGEYEDALKHLEMALRTPPADMASWIGVVDSYVSLHITAGREAAIIPNLERIASGYPAGSPEAITIRAKITAARNNASPPGNSEF